MDKHAYEKLGPIPQRRLGTRGVEVSAIGVGGHHLGDLPDVETAIELVHEAIDAGVTFFDNCWEYYDGKTEDWLGRALVGKRDRVFLMTKVCTHGRDGSLAIRMLEESLRRLQTDHLDLWQIHGVCFDDDPELAYRKGGVIDALDEAKRRGLVRFVGFTGHKLPRIHLDMITRGYPFDTVQMPLNCFDASFRSFEQDVLPEALRRGIAPIGMKSLGGTADMIRRGAVTHEDALRYAMSLPVLTTVAGMSSIDVLRRDLLVARGFTPMPAAEMAALRESCAPMAADGRFELYKLSLRYDNPVARCAHGFPPDPTEKEIAQTIDEVMDTHGTSR
jgi:predicted aldo/keto reductase-like oxidoreductase